jgi:peroxiredoxin
MKKSILGIIFVLFAALASGQVNAGYEINLSVSGLKDSTLFLAYHFGDKQYITDTATLDARGHTIFSGNKTLPKGIYMIVLPGRNYFEILMDDDQQFAVSCSYNDYFNTLKFSGSVENLSFVEYQKSWMSMQREVSAISSRMQNNKQNEDSLRYLSAKQKSHEEEMKSYLKKVQKESGDNLLSVLVRSMLPIDIPDFSVPEGTLNRDSLLWVLRYNYNKNHFFDNLDLTDERLLRTPILQGHLEAYFKVFELQPADSVNNDIARLIRRCQSNYKVFQFISVYLFNHFRESQIMGQDAILLKIADDIYLSGKADWVTKEFLEDLKKQTDLLRYNLIGMKAQDLVMDSYKGIYVSLYDVQKEFTILYFWEPNCGHCQEATPKLKEYYDKAKNEGVEVFAVCTTSDKPAWSKFIEDNKLNWINGWDPERKTHFDYFYNIQSTPLVYILDKNKKIIAKKLSVEDIPGFISNYRKYFK